MVGKRDGAGALPIRAGERVVYGQRVDAVMRITDVPATAGGRAYLVERELEQDGNAVLSKHSIARLRRTGAAPRRDPHARSPQPIPCARRGVSVEPSVQPQHRSAGRPRPRSVPADNGRRVPDSLRRDRDGRVRPSVATSPPFASTCDTGVRSAPPRPPWPRSSPPSLTATRSGSDRHRRAALPAAL